MTVLPFHYCFGTSLLHTWPEVGGVRVIDLRFMFSGNVLQRMLDTESQVRPCAEPFSDIAAQFQS